MGASRTTLDLRLIRKLNWQCHYYQNACWHCVSWKPEDTVFRALWRLEEGEKDEVRPLPTRDNWLCPEYFENETCKVCFDRDLGGNLSSEEWNATGPGERWWFCQRWKEESNWQKSVLVQDEDGRRHFISYFEGAVESIQILTECPSVPSRAAKNQEKLPLWQRGAGIIFENVSLEPE